ncbi:MAG: GGDEF domain-containing protein [Lachnospiraceae bacterium]|nr:GGDEF domain-containing protein [Lachnospiraceae bacterium]
MQDYFIYYASANIIGTIIFGVMLAHDRFSVDRQEKQLKYDQTLVAFMLYFISDTIWAAVDSELINKTQLPVSITNYVNFILMTGITYSWLKYVMAVEKLEKRNRLAVKHGIVFPFAVSAIILLLLFIAAPHVLLEDSLSVTPVFDGFMIVTPSIYIVAVIMYALKEIKREDDPIERRKHFYIAFFPVMLVAGGLLQMIFMPTLPLFCYAGTIFMLIFHMKTTDDQISTDPLTKLNNRSQLIRYVAQESNMRIEGRATYVVMMDINDFKKINDNLGHAEGDTALVLFAKALVDTIKNCNMPMFLGRFGGDEFVLIAHPIKKEEIDALIEEIRSNVRKECLKEEKPYIISAGIGYDELLNPPDTFQKCMQRADSKLYLDKEYCKINGRSTVIKGM